MQKEFKLSLNIFAFRKPADVLADKTSHTQTGKTILTLTSRSCSPKQKHKNTDHFCWLVRISIVIEMGGGMEDFGKILWHFCDN